jgi:hypothetical protein
MHYVLKEIFIIIMSTAIMDGKVHFVGQIGNVKCQMPAAESKRY